MHMHNILSLIISIYGTLEVQTLEDIIPCIQTNSPNLNTKGQRMTELLSTFKKIDTSKNNPHQICKGLRLFG